MFKNTIEKMKNFWEKNLENNAIKLSAGMGLFLVSLIEPAYQNHPADL